MLAISRKTALDLANEAPKALAPRYGNLYSDVSTAGTASPFP